MLSFVHPSSSRAQSNRMPVLDMVVVLMAGRTTSSKSGISGKSG